MNVLQASSGRFDVQLEKSDEDGRFWLVLRDFGVDPTGICTIIVSFFREDLTDGKRYEKLREREGGDPQTSLYDCLDPDHGSY